MPNLLFIKNNNEEELTHQINKLSVEFDGKEIFHGGIFYIKKLFWRLFNKIVNKRKYIIR